MGCYSTVAKMADKERGKKCRNFLFHCSSLSPLAGVIVLINERRGSAYEAARRLAGKTEGPWFDPLRFSFLLSSKVVVYGHCPVTLPEQLKKH